MSARVLLLCFVMSGPASAQGFAGLGAQAEGFEIPAPGYQFAFPVDHGPHTDFRIEWWYLTANLKDADGVDYGVQWTLFRTALAPGDKAGWSSPQLWMGHAALTSGSEHFVAERLARGGIGQAGVTPAPFAAWIDDWEMSSHAQVGADVLSALSVGASGSGFSYELALDADKPIVLHGKDGYSVKSTGAGQSILLAAFLHRSRFVEDRRPDYRRDGPRLAGPGMVVPAARQRSERLGLVFTAFR